MGIRLTALILASVTLVHGQLYDRLYRDLLSDYNKDTIPVMSKGKPVNVSFSLSLLNLNSLNAETGEAEMEAWLYLNWTDERLRWSPWKYSSVDTIRLPITKLWNPDIVLYNGYSDNALDPILNAVVTDKGIITKVPQASMKTRCAVEDGTATCSLKFGSWTYDVFLMDIQLQDRNIDLSQYTVNREWDLVDANANRNVAFYECCPEPYIYLSYTFSFRQNSGWFFLVG